MRFIKYYFGDPPSGVSGAPDPRKIFEGNLADELIERIVRAGPDAYIPDRLSCETGHTACELADIGVVRIDRNLRVNIACPIFFAQDLPYLKMLTGEYAHKIAALLISRREEYTEAVSGLDDAFCSGEHIYHLLCGAVFDGRFFDRLSAAGAVTVSRMQKGGYDYLPVLYEDDGALNRFSAELLCSYNRLSTKNGTFSSFGDADGNRQDMFRWYQRRRSGDSGSANELEPLVREYGFDDLRDMLGLEFHRAYSGEKICEKWIKAFEWTGYMRRGRICIPVYEAAALEKSVNRLDELTAECALDIMIEALKTASCAPELTAVRFGVPAPDIANEIYHLLFGQVNGALVRAGFAAEPVRLKGQGRFLRCFEIK